MSILQFLKPKGSAPSKLDEAAYEIVALELSSNQVKQGLWTKALADAEWDDAKARSLYVKMRSAQIVADFNSASAHASSAAIKNSDPISEAKSYGLTDAEIDYLGQPIKAASYLKKHKTSKKQIQKAIAQKKLTSVFKNDILWVSDKPI